MVNKVPERPKTTDRSQYKTVALPHYEYKMLRETLERIGGRGFCGNQKEVTEFARLVGQVARADERKKYERSNEAGSPNDGTGTGKSRKA